MKLRRVAQTAFATYGVLLGEDGVPHSVTLELPWVGNHRSVSCIPAGTYEAQRYRSPAHGNTDVFLLTNVPGRDAIEIHVGNIPSDSRGCILIGASFDLVKGFPGIAGSMGEFAQFMDALSGVDMFTLTVEDAPADG